MKDKPDKWVSGDAYEHFMGRWSRQLARVFIDWLDPPSSWKWLEVGCGTGALTQAICLHADPAAVAACDPSAQFVDYARRKLSHTAVTFLAAGAEALPHHKDGFDAAVSGLALNFIPAPAAAVQAMSSRLRPGGMLAACVWDYAQGMQFLRIFWETAVEMDSEAAELDERSRFPLCQPGALVELLEGAGLERVDAQALEIATVFSNFDDFWTPFLGGTGSAPTYVSSLTPTARDQLRLRLKQRLTPDGDGPLQLTARAWAVRGFQHVVPAQYA